MAFAAIRNRLCRRFATYSFGPESRLFKATTHALDLLDALPADKLEQCVNIFRENVFPPDKRAKIPELIEPVISDIKSPIWKAKLLGGGYRLKEELVQDALETLYEFLDKTDTGFLSGDFSNTVVQMAVSYTKAFKCGYKEHIAELVNMVQEHIKKDDYCLPEYGIHYLEYENPTSLRKRQEMTETNLPLVKFLEVDEDEKGDREVSGRYAGKLIKSKQTVMKIIGSMSMSLLSKMRRVRDILSESSEIPSDRATEVNDANKLAFLTGNSVIKTICKHLREDTTKGMILPFRELVRVLSRDIIKSDTEGSLRLFELPEPSSDEEPPRTATELDLVDSLASKQVIRVACLPEDRLNELCEILIIEFLRGASKFNVGFTEAEVTDFNPETYLSRNVNFTTSFLEILFGPDYSDMTGELEGLVDRTVPMICWPAPWLANHIGGYYKTRHLLLRTDEDSLQGEAMRFSDLREARHMMTILSQTPWRVNKAVMKVICHYYEKGGGVAAIPHVHYEKVFKVNKDMNYYERLQVNRKSSENFSLLSDFEIKLNIAKAFSRNSKFFLPLNMDFRGRIYPISPHLNNIGDDVTRGMLEFADAKPLGETGLKWLKIQIANKMGHDKLPLVEREVVVDEYFDELIRIAEDPYKNTAWLNYEEPWQALGAIFEFYKAIRSPNPKEFASNLHVHQDGSCNGLQHYAALGLDNEAAEQVNLARGEKPGDVYTAVAVRVQAKIERDIARGHELAEMLSGKIKRKVVKQTVMTSVYGVTSKGAQEQIKRQLEDFKIIEPEYMNEATKYLAGHTMSAIADLFEGAHKIKSWLLDCSIKMTDYGHPVCWITPLGIPVVQPYEASKDIQVKRYKSGGDELGEQGEIDFQKQRSSFPPNFVHSLDSTHLMYTAKECIDSGMYFAAVHDSFWTHACDVEAMGEVLRKQFVSLHSRPLLDDLNRFFKNTFPEISFKDVPQRGEFKLHRVLDSTYFFA
mmetsp:Transcript_32586/g.56469  ORF Transcript_32586/g.56469 Transcript_32586/m.56469 type:complete len:975 (+) Transcript_32586:7253-10177(+)